MTPLTDEQIRQIAKARAGFKVHAAVYTVVNLFFAAIWAVTNLTGTAEPADWYYWPIWPHMAWGVGLAIHGWAVYGGGVDLERREEEKLRQKLGG